MNRHNTLIFRILLVSCFAFAILRITLYFRYHNYFAQTSLPNSLWLGSRFDLKLLVVTTSPFLLAMIIPLPRRIHTIIRFLSAWGYFFILSILLCLGIADLAYFGEVNRHISHELAFIGSDIGSLWQTAISSRLSDLLMGMVTIFLLAVIWKRWILPESQQPLAARFWVRSIQCVAWLIFFVFLARGMVISGKPLDTIDAFNEQGQAQANLALNGSLTALQGLQKKQQQPLNYLDETQAKQWEKQYSQPFIYEPQSVGKPKNIVFILLESWSYRYIDALSGNHFGATPNMDKLVAQSQVWDNFYAAGQRSIIGIQAALTSVPALPNHEPIGFGLELNNMSRIAQLAAKQGYRTLMVQSSNRRSFHMDGIAQALGFQEYYGKEDIPLLRQYPQETPPFGWDYDTLMFLEQQISRQPAQPFFAFLFTGTTHEPYANPGQEFLLYPHTTKGEQGLLNTLKYSDWAIGEFMKKAAQQPWYHNTIFVFVADHTANGTNQGNDVREHFHIPLVVFEPNQQPARHQRLASQYDLLPTFADWFNIKEPVYTFGQSLLQPASPLPLMLNQGENTVAIAENEEPIIFQGTKILSGHANHQHPAYIQWRMQEADKRLRENRWASKQ